MFWRSEIKAFPRQRQLWPSYGATHQISKRQRLLIDSPRQDTCDMKIVSRVNCLSPKRFWRQENENFFICLSSILLLFYCFSFFFPPEIAKLRTTTFSLSPICDKQKYFSLSQIGDRTTSLSRFSCHCDKLEEWMNLATGQASLSPVWTRLYWLQTFREML